MHELYVCRRNQLPENMTFWSDHEEVFGKNHYLRYSLISHCKKNHVMEFGGSGALHGV